MARLGVIYQDIANAADQILGQGRQPTIELIRNLLGTGSTTTIANHLRKWRAEQDGSTSIAIKENLPQEFISIMKGLWQRVLAHAEGKIIAIKQETEQNINQLRQDADKYRANNQRWQKLHDTWIKEKDELTREKLSFEQAIITLQTEAAALTAKFSMQGDQLIQKQHHIDELHRLHQLAQENLEHYRESTRIQRINEQEKQAQQLQQLEFSLKNAEQQLSSVNNDKMALQQQLTKILDDHATLQKSQDHILDKFNKIQIEFTLLDKNHHETKLDALQLKKQHDCLNIKFDEQSKLHIELQKHNAVTLEQLTHANEQVKEFKTQNILLAREKWEIGQEKSQLEGIIKQLQTMTRKKETV